MKYLLLLAIANLLLVPGALSIEINGGTGVSIDNAKASSQGAFVADDAGAALYAETEGQIRNLDETHSYADGRGNYVEVFAKAVNGIDPIYSFKIEPPAIISKQDGRYITISAAEVMNIGYADSIQAGAKARNSLGDTASVGVSITQGSISGYKGSASAGISTALALPNNNARPSSSPSYGRYVEAHQKMTDASGNSIEIKGDALHSSKSSHTDTLINRAAEFGAEFQGTTDSYAGASTSTSLNGNLLKGALYSTGSANSLTKLRDSKGGAVNCDLSLVAMADDTNEAVDGAAQFQVDDDWGGKILSAIYAAWDGETINVEEGRYNENVYVDKSLKINGAGTGLTVIDGNKASSVFTIAQPASVNLYGMTITNGRAENGGGINNQGILGISGSEIFGNAGTMGGGGIANYGTLTVSDSKIHNNIDDYHGGGILNMGTVTISNSEIFKNEALFGGGMCNHGSATITGSKIYENIAHYSGGGIWNGGNTLNCLPEQVYNNSPDNILY